MHVFWVEVVPIAAGMKAQQVDYVFVGDVVDDRRCGDHLANFELWGGAVRHLLLLPGQGWGGSGRASETVALAPRRAYTSKQPLGTLSIT